MDSGVPNTINVSILGNDSNVKVRLTKTVTQQSKATRTEQNLKGENGLFSPKEAV